MAEGPMRWTRALFVLLFATLLFSCSSERWIHPHKKEQQLTYDYNACERDIMNSMTTAPGTAGMVSNRSIEDERVDKCLYQKGWRKIKDK
jgi:hypothetical protein